MSILSLLRQDPVEQRVYALGQALAKLASDTEPAYSLTGMLYLSPSGWLLLSVPNSLVRGVFDAMDESGVELPPAGADGRVNAHISVMRPEELERIGGSSKITERGKRFRYRIKGLESVVPSGWKEMSKVFFLTVSSPELKTLRRSYGLTPLPKGDHEFHITVAVRRRHVLGNNDTSKAAEQSTGV